MCGIGLEYMTQNNLQHWNQGLSTAPCVRLETPMQQVSQYVHRTIRGNTPLRRYSEMHSSALHTDGVHPVCLALYQKLGKQRDK